MYTAFVMLFFFPVRNSEILIFMYVLEAVQNVLIQLMCPHGPARGLFQLGAEDVFWVPL